MITVVIPLYNKEDYILDTVNLVLNQSFKDFELIVVDDGSRDNGAEIINSINDSRIKLISKENGGVSSARNIGVKESKYDYIAFLDADDEWQDNHLENLVSLINKYKEASVFVTNFFRKYPSDKRIINRTDLETGIIKNYFKEVLKENVIHTSSVAIKKSAFYEVGQFDERISRGEDIDLWAKLAKNHKIVYSIKATSNYIIDAKNNSLSKVFHPNKSIVYYLDITSCASSFEKFYYKKLIQRRILSYLLKDKKPKYAWLLIKKYKFTLL